MLFEVTHNSDSCRTNVLYVRSLTNEACYTNVCTRASRLISLLIRFVVVALTIEHLWHRPGHGVRTIFVSTGLSCHKNIL